MTWRKDEGRGYQFLRYLPLSPYQASKWLISSKVRYRSFIWHSDHWVFEQKFKSTFYHPDELSSSPLPSTTIQDVEQCKPQISSTSVGCYTKSPWPFPPYLTCRFQAFVRLADYAFCRRVFAQNISKVINTLQPSDLRINEHIFLKDHFRLRSITYS